MASSNIVLLLIFINILFFSLVSSHNVPCPPKSTPKRKPQPHPTCPTLKLGVCGSVLGIGSIISKASKTSCCSLLLGLVDAEAATCLCTALKANILGIGLDIPASLNLLLNYCKKSAPVGFKCD